MVEDALEWATEVSEEDQQGRLLFPFLIFFFPQGFLQEEVAVNPQKKKVKVSMLLRFFPSFNYFFILFKCDILNFQT